VFALWHTQASEDLHRLHADGVRALRIAQDRLDGQAVFFPDGAAPDGDMFFNINRRADQAFAQGWLENGVGGAGVREPLCNGGVP
jgi:molybdopterin-guanine dinucleotide biosynthesis protein A